MALAATIFVIDVKDTQMTKAAVTIRIQARIAALTDFMIFAFSFQGTAGTIRRPLRSLLY
jgi:hypothetical protein